MSQELCCPAATSGKPPYSVFERVLSLGWYDGTTSGLARCANCSSVFKYDIVDWDADQEQRIFALSRIDPAEFDCVVDILSASEKPHWPFWNPRWPIEPPELTERIKKEVDTYMSRANQPEYLIASDRKLAKIFAMRQLSESFRRKLPKDFDGLPITNDFSSWMNYLSTGH